MDISVAMTTYNGSKFVIEQMDSIKNQTRTPNKVLISDDGSTDDTVNIVNQYILDNNLSDTWEIHVNERNKGYARNFLETALTISDGLIFFCDQDDIWVADRLQVMAEIMESNPNINLLCSNLEPFYYEEDTRKWDQKVLNEMTNDGALERHTMDFSYFHLKRSGCTMCIRKNYLESIMPFWIPGWAHDDFVWKMAVASDSCAIIQYTSLKRRMHLNNASVVRIRTREWRINQLAELEKRYKSLESYVDSLGADTNKKAVLAHNAESIKARKMVVQNKHIWKWITLATKYKDCYPRRKGLYLDLYLSIFNEYKGAN